MLVQRVQRAVVLILQLPLSGAHNPVGCLCLYQPVVRRVGLVLQSQHSGAHSVAFGVVRLCTVLLLVWCGPAQRRSQCGAALHSGAQVVAWYRASKGRAARW